eukprot:TRINITY_DN118_c0_g1_i1.p1 TRINITY_DN118_c0_g1~~TRINITY_DN118_c0_g1_i1.p1  ORF type:complete len:412 (-),score=69.89 TRINITY_DN118_c0_g1_i1:188-1423(-)
MGSAGSRNRSRSEGQNNQRGGRNQRRSTTNARSGGAGGSREGHGQRRRTHAGNSGQGQAGAQGHTPYGQYPMQYYVMQNGMYGQQPWMGPGGQRMTPQQSAQYQSFLFHQTGIRPEIAFLPYPLPRQMPPPPPPPEAPEMQTTTTIRNDVNLKKNSLKLNRVSENDPNKYTIEFQLDCSVPCNLSVYYVAEEELDQRNQSTIKPKFPDEVETRHFDTGLGHKFTSGPGYEFDISKFSREDLLYIPNTQKFPLIIVLNTAVPGDEDAVQSQYTYGTLVRGQDNVYSVKVIKQKIQVGETAYELQEIFGIQAKDDDLDGGDCVICMSDPKDTTVLPCRHMCLCSECAKTLRFQSNKCPICRTPVESLLQIKVARGSDEEAEAPPPQEEEELSRKKKKKEKRKKEKSRSSTSTR